MAMQSPQAVADRWASGLSGATQKIKDGINAVTESPTAKAARAIDRMVAGVQRAAAEGKTQDALNAVSLQSWKDSAINKGVARIASGAQQAKPQMAAFMTQFLPFVDSARQALPARGDLEQNLARQNQMARTLAGFRYRRSG